MRYLVDGYNLFFKLEEDLLPLEEKREAFVQVLDQVAVHLKLKILIVFDSHYENALHFASKRKMTHIEVSFSPQNLSADAYLLELLEWNPKQTTLVTSDRELTKKGSFLGAKTMTIEAFVSFILKKQKKGTLKKEKPNLRETKGNFDRLLKEFEKRLDENDEK